MFFLVSSARSAVVYHEDFSSVAGVWFPVFNQNGGSATITSDGSLGSFFVELPNNLVAFAPTGLNPFVAYNSQVAHRLTYAVASLSWSTSYSIEIDQFDAGNNYLSTIFNVVPENALTGTRTVDMPTAGWDPAMAFILPKITMRTGDGGQTIAFDFLEIYPLPEPSTMMLLVFGGLLGIRRWRSINRLSGRSA